MKNATSQMVTTFKYDRDPEVRSKIDDQLERLRSIEDDRSKTPEQLKNLSKIKAAIRKLDRKYYNEVIVER